MFSRASPDQSLGAREELAQIKRFRHVIIRTGIEQLHDGFLAVPGAQYQHRRLMTAFAIADQETFPVKLRQHQVQNDQVVRARFSQVKTLRAVASNIDGIPCTFTQRPRDVI